MRSPRHSHEEGGGADVETLVKGLARHARMVPVLEVACDLVQRRQPGGHGAEQGLKESGGGKFSGIADDQPGLSARSPCQAFFVIILFKIAECQRLAR